MKAYCPRCSKYQECFEDVHWDETAEAYKFVCSCLAVVKFHFRKEMNYESGAEFDPDWLMKDVEVLRNA